MGVMQLWQRSTQLLLRAPQEVPRLAWLRGLLTAWDS
jgi:hypothetical protein